MTSLALPEQRCEPKHAAIVNLRSGEITSTCHHGAWWLVVRSAS